jgi:copper homeostasis protein
MRHDIEVAKALGAAGIVMGVLTARSTIDRDQTARLAALARPLSLTFHKAFDHVKDQPAALDILLDLGFDRVLTSGGQPTARDGVGTLKALVERAVGRIIVMAGGRLDAQSVPRVIAEAKVREIHLGSAVSAMTPNTTAQSAGAGPESLYQSVDAQRVVQIVDLVRNLQHVE